MKFACCVFVRMELCKCVFECFQLMDVSFMNAKSNLNANTHMSNEMEVKVKLGRKTMR